MVTKSLYVKEINALLKVAKEDLNNSQILLKVGSYRASVSRSYYVFLSLARAALLTENIITKSHAGAIQKFSLTFVKTGMIDKKWGRWFQRIFKSRQEADYEALISINKVAAKEVFEKAEEFLNIIEPIIQSSRSSK